VSGGGRRRRSEAPGDQRRRRQPSAGDGELDGSGGKAIRSTAASNCSAGARGVCERARRNPVAWSRDRGGVRVRRERVGGINRRGGLGWGLAFRGGGIGGSDGGGEVRAQAGLEVGNDRQAPPVSVSRRRRGYPFGRGGLSRLGRLLGLDRIGRRGPFSIIFLNLIFPFSI
jgi:hypothetical protein